ncbi:hypothetical protein V8C42DRAFT_181240 [Trichoderma barbatum]
MRASPLISNAQKRFSKSHPALTKSRVVSRWRPASMARCFRRIFGLFISFGWMNCVRVFQEYYENHQLASLSPSTGPFVGQLFDHFSPRLLLLLGSIIHIFGLTMASISSK